MGDFNAKTMVALTKCNYDSTTLLLDGDCNDNGSRLKNFCRSNRLCIASTYFDYPMENRYTWYSCDGVTKKVNDYVLTERFVQQYVTDCIARPEYDFNSDHRILITKLTTRTTRRSRWKKKIKRPPKLDIKSIYDATIRGDFKTSINPNLCKLAIEDPEEKSNRIVKTLSDVARATLLTVTPNKNNETWKKDEILNSLLNERLQSEPNSESYKSMTKKIKARVKSLKNQRLSLEAKEINENANRREEKSNNFTDG